MSSDADHSESKPNAEKNQRGKYPENLDRFVMLYLQMRKIIPGGDPDSIRTLSSENNAKWVSLLDGILSSVEVEPLRVAAFASDEGLRHLLIALQGGFQDRIRNVQGEGITVAEMDTSTIRNAVTIATMSPNLEAMTATAATSSMNNQEQSLDFVIDPQLGSWSWNSLPLNEPDPHDEFSCYAGKLPHGLRYVAARARGKKHKHEGTHCDDWYEVSSVGPWSLIAVSDGAGSKRISRVGARACTNEAILFLKQRLADTPAPSLASRKEWTDALQRDDLGNFVGDELRRIQDALAGSIKASFDAVGQAFEKRKSDGSWNTTLERDPELKDFRSTILVSLMCPIHFDGERRVFCLSVQVGDGLTVMYSDSVPLTDPLPLGAKDSGEYSSETEFLVDFKKWAELPRKIAVTVTPFRMLVSMTDGIDDIYDPRSGRDYNWILGELVLNQISPLFRSAESVDKAIEDIGGVGVVKQAVKSATQPRSKRLMASPETTVRIIDIGEYAKALGKRVVDLITRPEWLLAAHRYSAPITDEQTIEQRLLSWIDGKDVKGEFDDRAIVILFPDDGIAL